MRQKFRFVVVVEGVLLLEGVDVTGVDVYLDRGREDTCFETMLGVIKVAEGVVVAGEVGEVVAGDEDEEEPPVEDA